MHGKRRKMKKALAISTYLVMLSLPGCAGHTDSRISEGSDRELTIGTFRHKGLDVPLMVLEFGDTRFEARGFAIQATMLNMVVVPALYLRFGAMRSAIESNHVLRRRTSDTRIDG